MNIKKYLALCGFLLLFFLITSCSNIPPQEKEILVPVAKGNNSEKIPENPAPVEPENGIEALALGDKESNWQNINEILSGNAKVIIKSWSPDNKVIAFAFEEKKYDDLQMYIWLIGQKEPQIVGDVKSIISEFQWSPDGKFVLVDCGTGIQRGGYLMTTEKFELIEYIGYVNRAFWSPDSKWLAFGRESAILAAVLLEFDGSIDLVLYNVLTKEAKILIKATSEVFYMAITWGDDGKLHYLKRSFLDNTKTEELVYLYEMN